MVKKNSRWCGLQALLYPRTPMMLSEVSTSSTSHSPSLYPLVSSSCMVPSFFPAIGSCLMPGKMLCVHECLVIPWATALQAPLSTGFPRQEYWSGLPVPSPGDFPDPGMEPASPALVVDSLPLSYLGSPQER